MCPEQQLADMRSSTYGILFLGVPKDAQASFGNLGNDVLNKDNPSDTPLVAALKRDVRWLQDQIGKYEEISDEFVVTHFVESDGTHFISQVPPGDSKNEQAIRLNKTHGMMVRYASAEDEDFKKIAACLVNMAEQAPPIAESITWFNRS